MDGVVGLTQCAIGQSESFTYRFRIDESQSGTFWYCDLSIRLYFSDSFQETGIMLMRAFNDLMDFSAELWCINQQIQQGRDLICPRISMTQKNFYL